jgi:hypothetical protein
MTGRGEEEEVDSEAGGGGSGGAAATASAAGSSASAGGGRGGGIPVLWFVRLFVECRNEILDCLVGPRRSPVLQRASLRHVEIHNSFTHAHYKYNYSHAKPSQPGSTR